MALQGGGGMTRRTIVIGAVVTAIALAGAFSRVTIAHGEAAGEAAGAAATLPPPQSAGPASADPDAMSVPFSVGETAQYDVKFGAIRVGSASTVVNQMEQIRGRTAWHTQFRIKGGTFFYHVDDLFESWIDKDTFSSLRFYQTQQEGSNDRAKRYEIFPDEQKYIEMDKKPPREHPGVKDPLDDGSFLFFVRTVDLAVGKTYESNRYFRPEANPVRIRVVRTEQIEVPAGKFDCIVVQPVIKTKGIFSENGNAEVWLTNDPRHIVVQLKSKLSFGSINLYLKSYKPGA